PVVQPDAGEERAAAALRHDEIGDAAAKLATQSYMCVPLTVRDRVIGTVLLLSTDPLRRYGEADVNLAQDLARRAAMAVDNARLHAETKQAMEIKEESLALLDTLLATAPVGLAFVDR